MWVWERVKRVIEWKLSKEKIYQRKHKIKKLTYQTKLRQLWKEVFDSGLFHIEEKGKKETFFKTETKHKPGPILNRFRMYILMLENEGYTIP